MAAHLYGDLPEAKNKEQEDRHGTADDTATTTTPWSDVAKPPPPPPIETPTIDDSKEMTLTETQSTRTALFAPPRSVLKKQSSIPSAVVTDVHAGHRETDSAKFGYRLFGDIEDEYDPAKPNDYEAVIQERERKKREAEIEAEKQERLMQQQIEEKEQRDRERKEKRQQSPSHLEDEEEGRHHRRKITPSEALVSDTMTQTPATGEGKGMSLAQKMLEKYGWREGEGLGKKRQGMATPLIAQKTDKRSAVIVKAQQLPKTEPEAAAHSSQVPAVKGKPTRVVLLRNLVGPGKVDDDLEDEVANELQKYGHVQSVLIFEVTEDNFPAEEAVRTFIEFKTTDESRKAATALNGRFFGKRIVRAGYYDEAKFYGCDLAPVAGEFA